MPLDLPDLELHEQMIAVAPQVRVWAVEAGPQDPQRTILFVHGFGGWASQWASQLRCFATHARVIALDLRGHGSSDKPHSGYSMAEIVSDLQAVIEALDVEGALVLVGHSFGAAIVAQYAAEHPHEIERLILINPSSTYALSPLISWVFSVPDWLFDGVMSVINAVRKTFAAPAFVLKSLYWNALRPWKGDRIFPRVRTPTLVITPRRDPVFFDRDVARVAELLPHSERLIIPSYTHMLMVDAPMEVNKAIARFLGFDIRCPSPMTASFLP